MKRAEFFMVCFALLECISYLCGVVALIGKDFNFAIVGFLLAIYMNLRKNEQKHKLEAYKNDGQSNS